MSTTYRPLKKRGVAKTAWSYKDGGFDASVDGGQWLGKVHQYLQLPLASDAPIDHPRVPWCATAAQTAAWAERISTLLDVLRLEDEACAYIAAWRDFLATCGGYDSY